MDCNDRAVELLPQLPIILKSFQTAEFPSRVPKSIFRKSCFIAYSGAFSTCNSVLQPAIRKVWDAVLLHLQW